MTYRILTVCTGNICRSPMAQVVLAQRLREAGLDVEVDSAAVTPWEVGNPMDPRAAATLRRHGYELPNRVARKVRPTDFQDFDLILPMTRDHLKDLRRLAGGGAAADIELFRSFTDPKLDPGKAQIDVPDPWYGGPEDFEETLEILEAGVDRIADCVRANS